MRLGDLCRVLGSLLILPPLVVFLNEGKPLAMGTLTGGVQPTLGTRVDSSHDGHYYLPVAWPGAQRTKCPDLSLSSGPVPPVPEAGKQPKWHLQPGVLVRPAVPPCHPASCTVCPGVLEVSERQMYSPHLASTWTPHTPGLSCLTWNGCPLCLWGSISTASVTTVSVTTVSVTSVTWRAREPHQAQGIPGGSWP